MFQWRLNIYQNVDKILRNVQFCFFQGNYEFLKVIWWPSAVCRQGSRISDYWVSVLFAMQYFLYMVIEFSKILLRKMEVIAQWSKLS